MRIFDPLTTPRRDHYRWFRAMKHPWIAVTAEVDVTAILDHAPQHGRFTVMAHAVSTAVQSVSELRQRIRVEDGVDRVVEHDVVRPGMTLAGADDLFAFADVPFDADVDVFAGSLDAARAAIGPGLQPLEAGARDDLVFLSCLPWVRFTQVDHAMSDPADSIPRIAWGRLTAVGERTVCPVNIQAHHALVDGLHIGRFFHALESLRM